MGAALNTFHLHALIADHRPVPDDPAAYLSLLNDQLCELLPSGQYTTIFYGIMDCQAKSLIYAAAAQPSPILGRRGSSDFSIPETSGLPLGMKKGPTYKNRQVDFSSGAFLFLYSGALVETPLAEGGGLDQDGVAGLLLDCLAGDEDADPMELLAGRFHARREGLLGDDLTAVLACNEA